MAASNIIKGFGKEHEMAAPSGLGTWNVEREAEP